MTRDELVAALQAMGARRDVVSFDPGSANEALVIVSEPDGWHVYYAERGGRTGEHVLASEADACIEVLRLVEHDPTTRSDA